MRKLVKDKSFSMRISEKNRKHLRFHAKREGLSITDFIMSKVLPDVYLAGDQKVEKLKSEVKA